MMKIADNHKLTLLVRDCKAGKPGAQKAVYELYAGKMFAICLRYANDQMAAEDILQNGFIKIFTNIGSFKQLGALEGWMRKIMVHTAIEHYRKTAKMHRVTEIDQEAEEVVAPSVLDALQLKDLLQLIERLPDGYRLVFNMYVVEGYSHKEIAERLGISEGGSKSQLSRARQLLKMALIKREEGVYAK